MCLGDKVGGITDSQINTGCRMQDAPDAPEPPDAPDALDVPDVLDVPGRQSQWD